MIYDIAGSWDRSHRLKSYRKPQLSFESLEKRELHSASQIVGGVLFPPIEAEDAHQLNTAHRLAFSEAKPNGSHVFEAKELDEIDSPESDFLCNG